MITNSAGHNHKKVIWLINHRYQPIKRKYILVLKSHSTCSMVWLKHLFYQRHVVLWIKYRREKSDSYLLIIVLIRRPSYLTRAALEYSYVDVILETQWTVMIMSLINAICSWCTPSMGNIAYRVYHNWRSERTLVLMNFIQNGDGLLSGKHVKIQIQYF